MKYFPWSRDEQTIAGWQNLVSALFLDGPEIKNGFNIFFKFVNEWGEKEEEKKQQQQKA